MDTATIQRLVPQLFAIARQLEAAAPGRHFTPDGHLIGSIAEVLAAAHYGLTLTTASTKGIDAHDADGRSVEIKATAGSKGVALRGFEPRADRLIVVTIDATTGAMAEVFDGPAAPVWEAIAHKTMASNGQRQISLARLRQLQEVN